VIHGFVYYIASRIATYDIDNIMNFIFKKGWNIHMSQIYGNGIALSEKVLDYLWGRQTVTLNNIVNVDTPGFKSQYITFEDALGEKLRKASASSRGAAAVERAIDQSRLQLHTTWNESSRLDGNNVDMDMEQVDLVRSVLQYQYLVNSISNDINRLKSAARSF